MKHSEPKQATIPDATAIAERLSKLPPEKKAQFRALLKAKQIDSWQLPIVRQPDRDGRAPLSSAQQRLWFIEQYEEANGLYNLSGRLTLTGKLNLQAMRQAITELLQRHEILRSTYHSDDGQPWQKVESDYALPLHIEENVEQVDPVCADFSRQPFQLDRDLPVRIALLSEGGQEHTHWHLLLVLHHIAFDAWSEALLIEELAQLYDGFVRGQLVQLGEPELQYRDFALWQREWLDGDKAQEQRQFWQKTLANAPENTMLQFDFAYPDVQSRRYEGAQQRLSLSTNTLQVAKRFAQHEGTTLYNVMQAAFLLVLNEQGSGRDICLGTSVANRQRPELENLLGFLVNTLVLRHQLPERTHFRKLVSLVARTTGSAFEHQDYPFDRLLDDLDIPRGQPWSPLFQVLFVYRNVPRQTLALTDLNVEIVDRELTHSRFDLTVRLNEVEQGDGLHIDLEYSTELFTDDTIRKLLANYQQVLENALAAPDDIWTLAERNVQAPEQAAASEVSDVETSDEQQVLAEQIAEGYRALLGNNVTPGDSFFQQGGDSILALQLVARMKKSGIKLTPKLVFAKQTPLAIARELLANQKPAKAKQPDADSTGLGKSIPLAPIQAWFFEQELNEPDHWNQSVLLKYQGRLDIDTWTAAVRQVFALHPQLAARFARQEQQIVQTVAKPEWDIAQHQIPSGELAALLAAQQATFDLTHKAPIRVDLIELTDEPGGHVLFSAHHLVVDGVSWRVLISQICQVYSARLAGLPADIPAPSASFAQWAQTLSELSPLRQRKANHYWQPLAATDAAQQQQWVSLPGLSDMNVANPLSAAQTVQVSLNRTLTEQLTTKALTSYDLRIDDLLLAALSASLSAWRGHNEILVELEGHGRQHDSLDLSQTVGWFTSRYPALLRCPDADDADTALRHLILDTKAQLRQVRDQGQSFGILKYRFNDFSDLLTPSVVFNYLGQVDRGLSIETPDGSVIRLSEQTVPEQRHKLNQRRQWLDINGMVRNGELVLSWQFNAQVHSEAEMTQLAEDYIAQLSRLIEHATQAARQPMLADYPLAVDILREQAVFERTLSQLPATDKPFSDLYPLTPTQQGMLYHSLAEPNSGLYLNQSRIHFYGSLDTQALQQAWQALMNRHSVLRTGFLWQGLDAPLQYISNEVTLDWQTHSLIDDLPVDDQIQALAMQERHQGFDLTQPGLMRFRLVAMAQGEHCLIWTRHHLIVDGWCTGQMVAEVREDYQALTDGRSVTIADRPMGFTDFVGWLAEQDQQASLAYWQQLMGQHDLTERGQLPKPITPAASAVNSAPSDTLTAALDKALTTQLKHRAADHQLTLNALCQAVWTIVLSRYCNHRQLTLGITSSGRPDTLDNAEQIMGVMITTMPLFVDLTNRDQPITALAQTLQTQLANSREHEHVPLTELQSLCGVEGSLFDNLLVFENYPGEQFTMSDQLHFAVQETRERNHYPLTAILVPHEQLHIRLALNLEKMDADIAQAMLTEFICLLTHVAEKGSEAATLSCAHLSDMLAEQTAQHEWNQTEKTYDVPATLDAWLLQQAKATPAGIALVCPASTVAEHWQTTGDLTLTYQALNARAEQLAAYLQQNHGCERGQRVGLCLNRSAEMVIAMLACVKLGCAYVPLEPDMPSERLQRIMASAKPVLTFTQSATVASLTGIEVSTLLPVEEAMVAAKALSAAALRRPTLHTDDVLYVLYTSGSTGVPKGVAVRHGGIVNRLAWMQEAFAMQPQEAVLQKTPFGFDVSVWEFFWPLVTGARLVMAEPGAQKDTARLVELAQHYGVTTMHFVPPVLNSLLEHDLSELPVTRLICSGEALPYTLQQRMLAALPNTQLHNLYGPTEASIDVTWWDCRSDQIPDEVPIGRPIANMQTWVLDSQLNPVPVGVAGELYLAGIGLAEGYLGQPELTDSVFVANPRAASGASGDAQYSRLYRTGDLARFRPDGAIEYLGRADFQVKLRGLRIELGEIETALAAHPAVQETVVQLRPRGEDNALVAYVVLDSDADDNNTLIDHLRQRLPAYMVPEHIEVLNALPLTSNGKVNRKQLPEPNWPTAAFAAPETETENQLAELWQTLLGVERVGRFDHFFALGGHSLMLTRLVNRINQHFNLTLSLSELMDLPDLRSLAAFIDMRQHQIKPLDLENNDDTVDEREHFEL